MRSKQRSLIVWSLTILLALTIAFTHAFMQTTRARQSTLRSDSTVKGDATNSITIHASGQGAPLLNLQDGYELDARAGQRNDDDAAHETSSGATLNAGSSQPTALASGDFNEDGAPDLVTADKSGVLTLRAGNLDLIYPNSPEAQGRKAHGTFVAEPFLPHAQTFSVPEPPDMIYAGDFDADGHQDILAAADNSTSIYLLAGDGRGAFQAAKQIEVAGQVTAIATGQIGRSDNLTDVAVAVVTPNDGAQLLVYEHPEGTFKHAPEVFNLPSPATMLALGQLDADSMSDVAAACVNQLVIVHGHMQIYPWDLNPALHLQRPPAQIGQRTLGYEIAGLAAGKFTNSRRESLALLSTDGSIHLLEAPSPKRAAYRRVNHLSDATQKGLALPSNGQFPAYKNLTASAPQFSSAEEAKKAGYLVTDGKQDSKEILESLMRRAEQKPGSQASTTTPAQVKEVKIPQSFYTAPSRIKEWRDSILSSDAKLSAAARTGTRNPLTKARVSSTQTDDLIVLDSASRQIHLVISQFSAIAIQNQINSKNTAPSIPGERTTSLNSLDVEGTPAAVLPIRLNTDALTDIVVLRNGEPSPSVVMTAPTNTFTVNSTADDVVSNCTDASATCTLRDAITRANNNPGSLIAFNIPGSGVQTISPFTQLPVVGQPVTIDGTTQPGYAGTPIIEIKGNNFPRNHAVDGLKIRASNCVIRGLAINEFPAALGGGSIVGGNGLTLESLSNQNNGNNLVEGNFLGTGPSGTSAQGNVAANLNIFDSDNNTIGGTSALARNVMSGDGSVDSGYGIQLLGNNNLIEGNFVGTDATGNQKLPNTRGMLMLGSNNLIGGDAVGAGNVISGNGVVLPNTGQCAGGGIVEGLLFSEDDPNTNLTLNNLIKGNKIGTNASGTAPLGNCYAGIGTLPPTQLIIGSITSGGRNIISNNGYGAIDIEAQFLTDQPAGFTAISGDNIGTDITGTVAMPNTLGNQPGGFNVPYGVITVRPNAGSFVNVGSPGGTTPGGSCTGFCTLVSGNFDNNNGAVTAVFRDKGGEFGIFSSFVGTDISGTVALPNYDGVIADGETSYIGFPGIASGNLISGNRIVAVVLEPASGFVDYLAGNLIGTDTTGNNPLPNNSDPFPFSSVVIADASFSSGSIAIGGTNASDRNIISGNFLGALDISGNVTVQNNYIGVNQSGAALPNTGDGITSSGFVQIGGGNANQSNLINNNGKTGILVKSGVADIRGNTITNNGKAGVSVTGNGSSANIRANVIANNGDLGIDLGADGVTQNDCDDSDTGPNSLQNYPLLNTPTDNGNGSFNVHGTIKSLPHTTFAIDFYTNAAADPSMYGEGETYAGALSVTTGIYGIAEFDFTSANISAGQVITATATNPDLQTSEFSCGAGLCDQNTVNRLRETNAAIGCVDPIIVNTTGDEDDGAANDGVCDVDPNQTGNQCTLRAAIEEANNRGGGAFVAFDIPGGGVQTISPMTALPPITAKVRIDASTQPGYNDTPLIEVNGANVGNNITGLRVTAGPASIRGFAINNFALGNGIVLDGNSNGGQGGNSVKACFIGTTPDGTALSTGNMTNGIVIDNSRSNTIGVGQNETASFARNLIAGSTNSNVLIQGAQSTQNNVAGNYFDTSADGTNEFLNRMARGVNITLNASGNTVGGISNTLLTSSPPEQLNKFGSEFYGVLINENATGNTVALNAFDQCYIGIGIIRASNNTIGGNVNKARNVIGTCDNSGVYISDEDPSPPVGGVGQSGLTTGNTVQGNLIGTDVMGNSQPNARGIFLFKTTGNLIGGSTTDFLNVISYNDVGVILGEGANDNTLSHNRIGLDALSGTQGAGNQNSGVTIIGSNNKLIRNVIADNGTDGVHITNSPNNPNAPVPSGNVLTGNLIGTEITGTVAHGNAVNGILIDAGTKNEIGTSSSGNLISGNNGVPTSSGGVLITSGVTETKIINNRIGTNSGGTNALGNTGMGIGIQGSGNIVVNNTVSGNRVGIVISRGAAASPTDPAPANNIVQKNFVGLNLSGTAAIPNTLHGIVIGNGANNNVIGGLIDSDGNHATLTSKGVNSLGNVISGNTGDGIVLNIGTDPGSIPPFANMIQGNLVGTDKTGALAVPNVKDGIFIIDSPQNLIGGFGTDIPLARNVISGNTLSGIDITGSSSSQDRVSGNFIGTKADGTSALGNGLGGVIIHSGAHNNLVGGTDPNAGNIVAFNAKGVVIFPDAGCCNSVDPNLIYGNQTLGIDLGCEDSPPADEEASDLSGCSGTPVPNDPGDGDTGPNNLQNYPEFSSAIINASGNLVIQYKIDSNPNGNSNYGENGLYVEFFKADSTLQGQTFIGSTNYTTSNYQNGTPGLAAFDAGNAAALGISPGDKIVATATDADGNTSEFTSVNVGIVTSATPTPTPTPTSAGQLIISEFRPRGPNGASDEFIELYNTTLAPITVNTSDASAGFSVAASDGVVRCVIPNSTVIPAGGHFLCANSNGYSLGAAPATPDATYTADIVDNIGLALFNTATPANFSLTTRLDAVGSTSETNTLYKEGAGYPALDVATLGTAEHSFFRDLCNLGASRCTAATGDSTNYGGGAGKPKDTGDNASDFLFVSTNGASAGAGSRLGAPAPENLSAPIQRNATIAENLLDGTKTSMAAPNRTRDFTADPSNNKTFGTLLIRRRYTNNTGAAVTTLRFRTVYLTTYPAPSSGVADLRALASNDVSVSGIMDAATCASANLSAPCTLTVRGTALQQPPAQLAGGGFNSSLSVAIPGGSLASGASIEVQFQLGVQQTGSFRFYINIEALP